MWTFGHLTIGELFYVTEFSEKNNYLAPYITYIKIGDHKTESGAPANCKGFGVDGIISHAIAPDSAEVVYGPVPVENIYP